MYFLFLTIIQCMVFELLSTNLYGEIKASNFNGLQSPAKLKPLIYQVVEGLIYLKHLSIIHCDLKPENILFKDQRKQKVKIIDFGSSCSRSEEGYSYVQSRFYRAPEVILGLPYDQQVDMWSLGCIIAEMFNGRPLFPG